MQCKNCLMLELEYEILFTGESNLSNLQQVIDHLNRRKFLIKEDNNTMFVKESGVRVSDFCQDFMDMEMISFRVEKDEQWKPICEIENVLQLDWIDDVIREKRVVSFSQPIVDEHATIFGYEILSRFIREDESFIYPNEIFAAARSRGRLYALDRMCRLAAVSYSAILNDKKVFINFIPTSIYSPEFCLRSTMQLANELNIDPTQFIFEVVESDKVEDIDHLKSILAYYRERGFQYALDDVGEGYSTLEMLDDLKPQYMKLDMKYVQGVATDEEKQKIALLFLEKAFEVGAVPLAEGVEQLEDFGWLKEKGYQLFQGYLFGKPSAVPQKDVDVIV